MKGKRFGEEQIIGILREHEVGLTTAEVAARSLRRHFTNTRQVRRFRGIGRNGSRPHSALANRTPAEFRTQHIAVAAMTSDGQNFNPGLYA